MDLPKNVNTHSFSQEDESWKRFYFLIQNGTCCDMGQNDTIGKIELNPSFVLSSDNTNCKNDIQLFPQLFDELRVNGDYH